MGAIAEELRGFKMSDFFSTAKSQLIAALKRSNSDPDFLKSRLLGSNEELLALPECEHLSCYTDRMLSQIKDEAFLSLFGRF